MVSALHTTCTSIADGSPLLSTTTHALILSPIASYRPFALAPIMFAFRHYVGLDFVFRVELGRKLSSELREFSLRSTTRVSLSTSSKSTLLWTFRRDFEVGSGDEEDTGDNRIWEGCLGRMWIRGMLDINTR